MTHKTPDQESEHLPPENGEDDDDEEKDLEGPPPPVGPEEPKP